MNMASQREEAPTLEVRGNDRVDHQRSLREDPDATTGPGYLSQSKRSLRMDGVATFSGPPQSATGFTPVISDHSGVSVQSSSWSPDIEGFARLDRLTLNQNAEGYFNNAQNFVINKPIMYEAGTRIIYANAPSKEVLGWLQVYTMQDAEFDSSARDPPPRCHPGTRSAIIQRARDWFGDPVGEKKLLWIHGPAGVGKSAIIQTLVEGESISKHLGAALFFSKLNGRNNPREIFPTIAYQLAVRDLSYRAYLAELMADPMSINKAIREQFRKLILEPFVERKIRNGERAWIIALDGLDECGGDHIQHGHMRPGRHGNDYQCEIVQLISKFVQQHPSVPLIWVISSRPEPHLKAIFSRSGVKHGLWEEIVPVDSTQACRDVEEYLMAEFRRIRESYPDHFSTPTWPTDGHFLEIAKAASGLFVFASVVIHFIDNPWVGNPVAQLDRVLSVINKPIPSPDEQNPLATLDAIYTEILRRVTSDTWKVARRLLMISYSRTLPLIHVCNVLGIAQHTAVTALRHLHSVLDIPRADNMGQCRLRLYHTSFRDYLSDPSRSHEYGIDRFIDREITSEWWWGIFRVMQEVVATPEASLSGLEQFPRVENISLSWTPESHEETKKLLNELFRVARETWLDLIRGHLDGDDYEFGGFSGLRISKFDLLSVVQKIDFSKLVGGYVCVGAYEIEDRLVPWLRRLPLDFPTELKKMQILSYVPLDSLNVSDIVHDGVKCFSTQWDSTRFVVVTKSEHLQGYVRQAHREHFSGLLRLARLAPSMEVMILGCNTTGRCAVVSVADPSDSPLTTYYVFPVEPEISSVGAQVTVPMVVNDVPPLRKAYARPSTFQLGSPPLTIEIDSDRPPSQETKIIPNTSAPEPSVSITGDDFPLPQSPRRSPSPSGQNSPREDSVYAANNYLGMVRDQFRDSRNVFDQFMDVIREFKYDIINPTDVIKRVSQLFNGHPDLIQGSNNFLPVGYHSKCSADVHGSKFITVRTPKVIAHTTNDGPGKGPILWTPGPAPGSDTDSPV